MSPSLILARKKRVLRNGVPFGQGVGGWVIYYNDSLRSRPYFPIIDILIQHNNDKRVGGSIWTIEELKKMCNVNKIKGIQN